VRVEGRSALGLSKEMRERRDETERDDSPGRESMTAKRVKEWACLGEDRYLVRLVFFNRRFGRGNEPVKIRVLRENEFGVS